MKPRNFVESSGLKTLQTLSLIGHGTICSEAHMPKTKQNILDAQTLVREILSDNFNQKVSAKALRAAAEKVVAAVPAPSPKKAA